jgi:hypothetical protein
MFSTPGRMAGIYRSGNHAQAKAYFAFRSAPLDVGRRVRNILVRLPLLRAASAVERRLRAGNARPLPEYAPAR